MPTTHRIANLVGNPAADGRIGGVPAWAVGEGFTSEVVTTRIPIGFLNGLDFSVSELAYAEAGMRAEREGYAGVFINTVGDYGIRPLRAALRIPVVGCGQAAMQMAVGLGRRFAIVTVWPPALRTMYDRMIDDYGFREHCTGVRFVTSDAELPTMRADDGVISGMRAGRTEVLDRIETVARQARDDGADVIVLGCTCMSPARDELAQRLGCEVLDPLVIAHKMTEMLVTLGLTHVAAPTPPSFDGMVRTMFDAVASPAPSTTAGTAPAPALAEPCDDACELLEAPETAATVASAPAPV
jgi:allantoin racemase